MNILSKYAILATLAVSIMGMIGLSPIAFSEKPDNKPPTDPDCFGEEASNLGGELGEHSRDGSNDVGDHPFDDDGKKGRSGIGNLDDHPSELAEGLNGAENCEPN